MRIVALSQDAEPTSIEAFCGDQGNVAKLLFVSTGRHQTLYRVLTTDNSTCRLALTGTAILIKSRLPSFLQIQGVRHFFSVQCVLAQWCLFLIAMFGDIGFDHPGRYGLSFDHLIYLAIAYALLSLAGLVASFDSYKLVGLILFDGVFHVVVFMNTN